jgi:ribosomal protein S18 acetylase RimI-like enzyme
VNVRPVGDRDRAWVTRFLEETNSTRVAAHGELLDPPELLGLIAERDGEPIGLATYRIDGDECELVTLHSAVANAGAGSALIDAVAAAARDAGCRRLYLITTNDNTNALRFYQRRGLRLVALRPGAVDKGRRTLKPEIGEIGNDGIPIRDELELELQLRFRDPRGKEGR